jgi:hypothetical protein
MAPIAHDRKFIFNGYSIKYLSPSGTLFIYEPDMMVQKIIKNTDSDSFKIYDDRKISIGDFIYVDKNGTNYYTPEINDIIIDYDNYDCLAANRIIIRDKLITVAISGRYYFIVVSHPQIISYIHQSIMRKEFNIIRSYNTYEFVCSIKGLTFVFSFD